MNTVKKLTVYLTAENHEALKIKAALEGSAVSHLIDEMVNRCIEPKYKSIVKSQKSNTHNE